MYKVIILCDRCGNGFQWEDKTVNRSNAIDFARQHGWSIGKHGWLCDKCKNNNKGER